MAQRKQKSNGTDEFHIRLDVALGQAIRKAAEAVGRPVNTEIARALRKVYLENKRAAA